MSMFYKKLDWNKLPEKYSITDEQYMIENFSHAHPVSEYEYYRQYKYDCKSLCELLQPLFNFDLTDRVFIQIIKNGIGIHKDIGRSKVYNYLLDTGGDNVYTRFYDEDKKTELFKINIPLHTWHQLDVTGYHNVTGIQQDRISITIYESLSS